MDDEMIVLIIVTVLTIGLLLIFLFAMSAASCSAIAHEAKLKHTWSVMTGCMVEVNGKMVPLDNWREISE